ncbi:MAG: hypothetical protein ACP5KO_02195 [Caldimicrobium sp.]|jgi:Mg/Co/Ni transporter MgtE|uniref:Uncharacterized protein n=1 Tax=Caldimicrobium thiodismutans TaxID=1653476 RepID=A0A2N7PLH6_9BACT|nr:MAG: hypothetical protein C0197_00240 [Caldimicrobium thiodismutans]
MTRKIKKGAFIGAFVGLVIFVILGFLPSAYTGGLIGFKLAEMLFGSPLAPSTGPRILVGILMILNVIISGAFFIVAGAIAGWMISTLLEKKKIKEKVS